jgi:hypothetical protein
MAASLVAHHRPGFYSRVLEEGEVRAGDEIVKVAEGPERLTVVAVDALLYRPGLAKEELERALRIPALSPGWKSSFEALLRQMTQPGSRTGKAGLASPERMVTAVPGFRPPKVARVDRESSRVVSLGLERVDGRPLTTPLPGQFVVSRLRPKLTRLQPCAATRSLIYRTRVITASTINEEAHGIASTYLST